MMKKLRDKFYNEWVTTRENDNVQSHDQEENKLNSAINAKSGTYKLTHDEVIKSLFNQDIAKTIKGK